MKAEPGGNTGDFRRQGNRGREMTIYLALCLAHCPSFLKTPKVNESAASFLTQSWAMLALQILQWGGKKKSYCHIFAYKVLKALTFSMGLLSYGILVAFYFYIYRLDATGFFMHGNACTCKTLWNSDCSGSYTVIWYIKSQLEECCSKWGGPGASDCKDQIA